MFPLELTFRNMKHSDAIEAAVRERAEKLEKFFPRITSCRVIVEQGARKSTAPGLAFHVRVDVRVPGGEFVGGFAKAPLAGQGAGRVVGVTHGCGTAGIRVVGVGYGYTPPPVRHPSLYVRTRSQTISVRVL